MFQPLFHNPWVHKSPVTKKPEQQHFPTPVKGEYSLEISVLCHNGQDAEGPVARGGQWASDQDKTALAREKFCDFFEKADSKHWKNMWQHRH